MGREWDTRLEASVDGMWPPPAHPPADPEGLRPLKFLATRWHIAFSSMLVLGLLLSTLM